MAAIIGANPAKIVSPHLNMPMCERVVVKREGLPGLLGASACAGLGKSWVTGKEVTANQADESRWGGEHSAGALAASTWSCDAIGQCCAQPRGTCIGSHRLCH